MRLTKQDKGAYTAPKRSSTSSGKSNKQSKSDTTSSKSDTTTVTVNAKEIAKKTIRLYQEIFI